MHGSMNACSMNTWQYVRCTKFLSSDSLAIGLKYLYSNRKCFIYSNRKCFIYSNKKCFIYSNRKCFIYYNRKCSIYSKRNVSYIGQAVTEQMVVGLPLVLEGEPAVGHVVEVLEPLEVGHGHTPSVDVEVGDHQNVPVLQDFVGRRSAGTIGSFGYHLQHQEDSEKRREE